MPRSEPAGREAATPRPDLEGVVVPLVTPLDERRRVCKGSVARLVSGLRPYVSAFMPTLSTGEGWHLTLSQWADMVRATVANADGAPVLAGVELGRAGPVLERARLAAELGADAVVVPPPFPRGAGCPGLLAHYRQVTAGSELPVVVYHENAVSGTPLDAGALAAVCALPGVIGVKESSGSGEFTAELLAHRPGVPVLQGWEQLITSVPGVAGFVGPLANLHPGVCRRALDSFAEADQRAVDALCGQYHLFDEDWYRHVKLELARRGTISTPLTVR
ncbi:hypothetical protein AQ490_18020 [Wenjunlia vitaminophila]|uniref:Dihydrodipicolinate synthase family protein n=1 Tax=Wenjunlia vitaminophila TaxID=76728 RepID=A0A0T6LV66_WENVI|nr:dihydrodipicolinate synthase family protein [Wenjunlia vitaminophila]KRV49957.1 hypothetical protein AQ490_18020 [Wenjunlia vitaminophila]